MRVNTNEEAFDVAESILAYCSHNYAGDADPRYAALCALSRAPILYHPSPIDEPKNILGVTKRNYRAALRALILFCEKEVPE